MTFLPLTLYYTFMFIRSEIRLCTEGKLEEKYQRVSGKYIIIKEHLYISLWNLINILHLKDEARHHTYKHSPWLHTSEMCIWKRENQEESTITGGWELGRDKAVVGLKGSTERKRRGVYGGWRKQRAMHACRNNNVPEDSAIVGTDTGTDLTLNSWHGQCVHGITWKCIQTLLWGFRCHPKHTDNPSISAKSDELANCNIRSCFCPINPFFFSNFIASWIIVRYYRSSNIMLMRKG